MSLSFRRTQAGGHLSDGYIHGLNHVEGVRQICGTSTLQVTGAKVSLVTSAHPGTSAMILVVLGYAPGSMTSGGGYVLPGWELAGS
jgi:hypothetical protein